jgi:hypothetical protein
MANPPEFATVRFRFNVAYKIRILIVVPSNRVTIDSELSLCGVFLNFVVLLSSREKGTVAKHEFAEVHPKRLWEFQSVGLAW